MRKTGGKMNAATAFYDSMGNNVMNYVPQSFSYHAIGTETEFARQRAFAEIYNTEFARLKNGV